MTKREQLIEQYEDCLLYTSSLTWGRMTESCAPHTFEEENNLLLHWLLSGVLYNGK